MKIYLAICFLSCFLVFGCSEPESSGEDSADLSMKEKLDVCEPLEKVKRVEDSKGIILYDPWLKDFVLSKAIDGTYDSVDIGFICHLPEEFQKDGLKVLFSGTYFEIDEAKKEIIPVRIIGMDYFILEIEEIQTR